MLGTNFSISLSLSLFVFLTFIDLAQWTWDRSPSLGDFTQKIKKTRVYGCDLGWAKLETSWPGLLGNATQGGLVLV